MAVNSFTSNQGTQTPLLTDNTGGAAGTLIPVYKLSIDGQGTFTNSGIWNGSVTGIGTVAGIGSVSGLSNLPGGTLGSILGVGSVSGLSNLPGGTLNNLASGTINSATVTGNLGTIGTVGLATITGNIGTIGTLGLGSVQSTGTVNVGTVNTGTVNTGTINVATVTAGSIVVTAGTVSAGTINSGTLNTGTVNLGSIVKITPAASAGSFTAAGSIVVTGSQLDYAAFDIGGTWVGTVITEAQIGTSPWFNILNVSSLGAVGTAFTANGDYFVSMAGFDGVRARLTYSSGTLTYNARQSNFFAPIQSILGGSLGNVGMLNAGTISSLPNLPQGSINVTAGTVSAGTVNVATITAGTVNVATITTGTLSPIPTIANVTYGTHGTTGASVFGTLAGGTGSGAGTEIFITSLSLSIPSTGGSQDVSIGWGTNGGTFQAGTGLLVRGNFPPGGGIQKTFWPPVNSGTQAQLCLFQAGAGTVDVSVTYFITASTL